MHLNVCIPVVSFLFLTYLQYSVRLLAITCIKYVTLYCLNNGKYSHEYVAPLLLEARVF